MGWLERTGVKCSCVVSCDGVYQFGIVTELCDDVNDLSSPWNTDIPWVSTVLTLHLSKSLSTATTTDYALAYWSVLSETQAATFGVQPSPSLYASRTFA